MLTPPLQQSEWVTLEDEEFAFPPLLCRLLTLSLGNLGSGVVFRQ